MLETKNLKKHFGGVKAVNNCSFSVKPGTITALIGPNGAGKSTVFNLISGILKPDQGEVFFGGKEITRMKPERISNLGISRVFQKSTLFKNLTVKDNLKLALSNEDTKFWKNLFFKEKKQEKEIKEMLKLVEMERFKNHLASELSFGQKRLIELVRSILNPHQLLMLDEPVAGVNPKLREKISEILIKLRKKGETILLIEHDMQFTLKISDFIIVLDEGRVIAEGNPEQVKNNPKVLEAYLGE